MAVVVKNPRETRIQEKGCRGIREAILAGPASGSNRFTVRKISLEPDGCTARGSSDRAVVYFVHKGRVTLSHSRGELDLLSPGNTATVHADEVHHLHNIDNSNAVVVKVAPQ
ncbi:MAG: hypothetical protein KAH54_08995 [Candidatus Sabulitectum sp.]|nr:hypothetical protein [Candidatus Sabulitectum sp.]